MTSVRRKQEDGIGQIQKSLRTYSTSYPTSLQSFKSCPFTISEKSSTEILRPMYHQTGSLDRIDPKVALDVQYIISSYYPTKFQVIPIYGFWEKLDGNFKTYVPPNRKLGPDRSESRLGRTVHHIQLPYQVSSHSHLRFLRKGRRKF